MRFTRLTATGIYPDGKLDLDTTLEINRWRQKKIRIKPDRDSYSFVTFILQV